MSQEAQLKGAAKWQLPLQTFDLIAAFMVWVIISTLLPYIKEDIYLSQDISAWVVAVPVILGSALRIPFGYLAGKCGARIVYIVSFAFLLFPIFFIAQASTFSDLLISGLALGVAGAVFSVGVTSLPRYYPKNRQGFVNGVYGLGNIGTAVSAFAAPFLATHFGWRVAVQSYLVLMLIMVALNFFLGDRSEKKLASPVMVQLKGIYRDYRLWILSFFYFVTFGAFVAFTMIMPDFLTRNFSFDGQTAGLITGIFIVEAAGLRVVGGSLADRFSPYKILAGIFAFMMIGAFALMANSVFALFLAGIFLIGICCGIGNGVVFKLVPADFPTQVGLASGFVAMMGGFGGFFPPLILSFFFAETGSYAGGFFLYALCIGICLVVSLFLKRTRTTSSR